MQRRITTLLVLTLVLLYSLSFVPVARGQESQKLRADTGVIAPSTHQLLRVTAVFLGHNDLCGGKLLRVRFRWAKYSPLGCNNDGACRHTIFDNGVTAPVEVNVDESASFDMHGTGDGIRVVVEGSCRATKVIAQIIDKDTGKVLDALDINDLF